MTMSKERVEYFEKSREIFLHGDFDSDGEVAMAFIKYLRQLINLSAVKPIIIHMYLLGGDYCCGAAIMDAIDSCETPLIIVTYGQICSMGTVICAAANQNELCYVLVMPNCLWMLHQGTTGISDNLTHKQSKAWSEIEDVMYNDMMNIYIDACKTGPLLEGESSQKIKNHIERRFDRKEDWFITAEQVIEYGFAYGIIGTEECPTIDWAKKNLYEG